MAKLYVLAARSTRAVASPSLHSWRPKVRWSRPRIRSTYSRGTARVFDGARWTPEITITARRRRGNPYERTQGGPGMLNAFAITGAIKAQDS